MRFLLAILMGLLCSSAWSQSSCKRSSTLFQFDQHIRPRAFTEKLGNHPQFPFLQQVNGVTTRALFIAAAKNPESRKTYQKEFPVFNHLLQDIGFAGGYKDLKAANVENLFINPGTIGNLGFFNKESNYIYVRLNPAGEGDDGIAAWKITGPGGCSFYILHTCGNAFFANDPAGISGGNGCCRDIKFRADTDTLPATAAPHDRPLVISIRFYQAVVVNGKKKTYDTLVRLVRSIDTTTMIKDSLRHLSKVVGQETIDQFVLCRDTTISLHIPIIADSTKGGDTLYYTLSDTTWVKALTKGKDDCHKKWEIAVDGGASYNSIPRFDNTTQHSRTNGAQFAGELAVSRIFNHWFQAGISASYITLSYQDDVAYAGSAPNTYNTVYPGKPIIPVQLFGKFTFGGPLGWQSNFGLSAGLSIPGGSKIVNSGNTLADKPSTKSGLTAGVKMGIAYFFSCKFGVAASVSGQYFNNKGSAQTYKLVALPVTLGIRYRF